MSASSPHDRLPEVTNSLRQMARALVGDELEAEDLVQDAWVAALQAPRDRVRNQGAWLRGVVRRLAAQARRRARTRAQHEERAARPDWVESESQLVERLSSAHLLVETVATLDDPYGAVLRLHYFDELPLDEIARQLDRPLATVKTWRLRGLERLREALDRRMRGDRSAWATALGPLLSRSSAPPTTSALVAWPTWIGATALFALLGVIVAGALRERRPPEPVAVGPPAATTDVALAPAPDPAGIPSGPRTPAGAPVVAAAPPDEPTSLRSLAVRVVDAQGRAAVGARVFALDRERTPLAQATTDAEGRARIEISLADAFVEATLLGPEPRLMLCARAPGYARSADLFVDLGLEERPECVLELPGPGFDLRGWVVDEHGDPIEGVVIENDVVERRLEHRGTDIVLPLRPEARTDAAGRFELEAVHHDQPSFRVLRDGYVPRRVVVEPPEPGGAVEREITLSSGWTLRGVVRRPDGSAAPGALVTLPHLGMFWAMSSSATADGHGRYELTGIPEQGGFVHAVDASQPGLWNGTVLRQGAARELTWDVTLERRDAIRIELRDEHDRPLGRRILALVSVDPDLPWLTDGVTDAQGRASFRITPDVPLELAVYGEEFIGAGSVDLIVPEIAPSAELQVFHVGGGADPELARLRASLAPDGGPGRFYAYHFETKSQHEGRFDARTGQVELSGLQPGDYELFVVLDERGLLPLGALELAPGDDFDFGPISAPRGEPVRFTAFPAEWTGQREAELVATYEVDGTVLGRSVRRVDLREARELELLPTDYRLRLDAAHSIREIWFTVWPDEPLEVDVARRLAEDREDAEQERDPLADPDSGGR